MERKGCFYPEKVSRLVFFNRAVNNVSTDQNSPDFYILFSQRGSCWIVKKVQKKEKTPLYFTLSLPLLCQRCSEDTAPPSVNKHCLETQVSPSPTLRRLHFAAWLALSLPAQEPGKTDSGEPESSTSPSFSPVLLARRKARS